MRLANWTIARFRRIEFSLIVVRRHFCSGSKAGGRECFRQSQHHQRTNVRNERPTKRDHRGWPDCFSSLQSSSAGWQRGKRIYIFVCYFGCDVHLANCQGEHVLQHFIVTSHFLWHLHLSQLSHTGDASNNFHREKFKRNLIPWYFMYLFF